MTPRFHTKKILGGVVLVICGLLAGYITLATLIMSKQKELGMTTTAIVEAQTMKQSNASLTKLLAEISPELTKVHSYSVGTSSAVSFIEMLEDLGRDAGVNAKVTSVNLDTGGLKIIINAGGSWQRVMHFVNMFESLPYNIHIERLGFHSGEESNSDESGDLPVPGQSNGKVASGPSWSVAITFSI